MNRNNNPISRVAYTIAAILALLGGLGWYGNNSYTNTATTADTYPTETVNETDYVEVNDNEKNSEELLVEAAIDELDSPADSSANDKESFVKSTEQKDETSLGFKNAKKLEEHYEKHGIDMGFNNPEEYEKAAAAVVANPKSLHKTEAEDGDDVYYLEESNEFVIVSTKGYIRTYYNPQDGIAYFDRQ